MGLSNQKERRKKLKSFVSLVTLKYLSHHHSALKYKIELLFGNAEEDIPKNMRFHHPMTGPANFNVVDR